MNESRVRVVKSDVPLRVGLLVKGGVKLKSQQYYSSLKFNWGERKHCNILFFNSFIFFLQVLVIEQKSEDGSWPRQTSHPKWVMIFIRILIPRYSDVWHAVTRAPSHRSAPPHQIQYNAIQEFHYLPKAVLQLHHQYCSVQPRLHAEQQQLQQQARPLAGFGGMSADVQHLGWNQTTEEFILFTFSKWNSGSWLCPKGKWAQAAKIMNAFAVDFVKCFHLCLWRLR